MYIYIFLCLNAIIGALAFEWAWTKIKPLRKPDEKIDSQFPQFRRYDQPKWSKLKFYIGAITWMPFRFCIGIGIVFFLFAFLK